MTSSHLLWHPSLLRRRRVKSAEGMVVCSIGLFGLFSFSENSSCPARSPGCVDHKSDNSSTLVEPVKNGIWEWPDENLVKIEICFPINRSVLLDLWQVAVKCRNEAISESGIPILVIPSRCLRNVLQHGGKNPEVFHARSALNSFLNWSTVSAEDGFCRNTDHRPSNISFSS